mmetsp:Transcript_3206/g.9438  ORF Transcript_3206/g.9438 Transcript_3206/m.9438 type:complete len:388 (+) Transcript_3206:2631-3794(+)
MVLLRLRLLALEDRQPAPALARWWQAFGMKLEALLRWNDCVPGNHGPHASILQRHPDRERRHVEQQEILTTLAAEDAGLHSGSVGHGLFRVDAGVVVPRRKKVAKQLTDFRHARASTHSHNVMDLCPPESCRLQHLSHRIQQHLEEVVVEPLKPSARERVGEILAKRLKLQVYHPRAAQHVLGLFSLAPQPGRSARLIREILAVSPPEDVLRMAHDALGEVLAAEVRVAARALDFKHPVVNGQQRHVQRAPAHVKDEDVPFRLLVKAKGNGGRSWLVYDSEHLESSKLSGILRGLPLGIVEVGWHCQDSVPDFLSQVILCCRLQTGHDERGDLLGRQDLALPLYSEGDCRLSRLVDNSVWDSLDVLLGMRESAAEQALHAEQRLPGI